MVQQWTDLQRIKSHKSDAAVSTNSVKNLEAYTYGLGWYRLSGRKIQVWLEFQKLAVDQLFVYF